jgi:copper homeostasis protein
MAKVGKSSECVTWCVQALDLMSSYLTSLSLAQPRLSHASQESHNLDLITSTMLEIACFNSASAIAAAKAGADRIELCADYAAGGVTPSLSTLQDVRKETTVPINVMIRPRGGDFNYSDAEFERMKKDIEMFKASVSGSVFGILDSGGCIDEARNRELVEWAAPLPCTFHRAIDEVEDLQDAVEELIRCGFKAILTSGGMKNALEGAEKVGHLQEKLGTSISLILGGGVRSTNVGELKRRTRVPWFHSAAITAPGEDVDAEEVKNIQQILGI